MIKASEFLLKQNHAMLENFDKLKEEPNHPKKAINFMKGDPTEFGHQECKMNEIGYEAIRSQINLSNNHSYCHSTGTSAAKQAIAKHFDHGHNLNENDVVITQGVNQGLLYCLLAMCDPGTNILVPELGYPFFDGLAEAYQVEVRKYHLQSNKNWEIDIEDLQNKLDQNTKFIYVINPSNPCGSVFSSEHIIQIINWAQENKVLIVADEVYYGMAFEKFNSFGEYAQDGPIICLNGMEKAFFTPGWQISWMIFYDKNHYAEDIKHAIFNLCQLLLHPNVFLMNSIPEILDKLTINFASNKMQHFKQNHDYLIQEINKIKGLQCIPAQGTIYLAVLINLEQLKVDSDTDFSQQLLKEQNIKLLPLSWNGTSRYQGFRILTIANQEIYDDMLERLRDFVSRR